VLDGILQGRFENFVDALIYLALCGVKDGTAAATIGHESTPVDKQNNMLPSNAIRNEKSGPILLG
jgi:hypothetical protein